MPLIQVDLSAGEISIEPGGTANLTVTIANKQELDDHVSIEIEGLDVEWYALPVPSVTIPAGGSQSARVLFRLTRASTNAAGTYPFIVRARGMESADSGVAQAILVVKPYSSLQVEMTPKRGTATFTRRQNVFDVTVTNLGNHDETLEMFANDPEDALAYEFESDRVTLKPGRSETVPLVVEPMNPPVLGTSRLFGFAVTARSVEDSFVSGNVNGQLERRALLSPLFATLLAVLIAAAGFWAVFRPRPVVIREFGASPVQVMAGEEVTLGWDVSNLGEGYIQPDNVPIRAGVGSVKLRPTQSMNYTLVVRGGGHTDSKTVGVVVTPPPTPNKPKILEFTTSRARIHQGDTVILQWKLKDATSVTLNPIGKQGDWPAYKSQEVVPTQTTPYELVAKGPGGFVDKKVKIEVVDIKVSTAEINSFRAKPSTVAPGEKATLSWSVAGSQNIEIDNGVGGGLKPKDKFDVTPAQTTIYTLRALDDKGNLRTAQVTVTVKPKEVQPPDTTEPGAAIVPPNPGR